VFCFHFSLLLKDDDARPNGCSTNSPRRHRLRPRYRAHGRPAHAPRRNMATGISERSGHVGHGNRGSRARTSTHLPRRWLTKAAALSNWWRLTHTFARGLGPQVPACYCPSLHEPGRHFAETPPTRSGQ